MAHDDGIHAAVTCGDCPIRHRAVCARCEGDEIEELEQIKYFRSFEAGQTVIWAGDRMDFVASLISGVATLTQTLEDGRTQMVGLLLPSDFFGRPGRGVAAYNVIATTSSTTPRACAIVPAAASPARWCCAHPAAACAPSIPPRCPRTKAPSR